MTHRVAPSTASVALLLALPALHPLLIPLVGVPSHLLWWTHVLPVALITYRHGRRAAAAIVATSALLVVAGERAFGAGYGTPADWFTVGSLAVALTFTNLLVAGFALYARALARRYRLLFEGASIGILRTDDRDRVIAANPAAARLIACPENGLRGRPLHAVPGFAGVPSLTHIVASGGWTGELRLGCEEPRSVHVLLAGIRQDDPVGHQVMLVDRTFEVAQEQEIERGARLAALGETLASVAHELKNPLQTIMGYAELGAAGEIEVDETRDTFETIRAQAARMRGMVQDLLGFSRPAAAERVNIADLVRKIVRMQRVAHRGRVEILEHVAWEGYVAHSADRVSQILTNLVSNAVDAAARPDGRVDIVCDADRDFLTIRVLDNGPGIAPDVARRLFQPFVSTKPDGKGTGLGLAISRRLAHSMQGTLEAENRPEGGAAFTLRLPLTAGSANGSESPGDGLRR